MNSASIPDRIAKARRMAASGRYKTLKALAKAAGVHASTLRRHGVVLSAAARTSKEGRTEVRLTHAATAAGGAHNLVEMAVAERPDGPVTKQLQAESPNGLAHSAISALRRGEQPSPEAQASLDAVLGWRDAWSVWWEAYSPYHGMRSRWQQAVNTAGDAHRRAETARSCVDWYGGKLGYLSAHDAGLRLRGAFAQRRGLAGGGSAAWRGELDEILSTLNRHHSPDVVIAPPGGRLGDYSSAELDAGPGAAPAEPLIAAWSRTFGTDGLRRAARRWASAAAAPLIEAETTTRAEASAARHEANSTSQLEVVGRDAVTHLLTAADAAASAAVRISDHQTDTINELRGLLVSAAAAALTERLNDYDGDDWFNDVAADCSDIVDFDTLDNDPGRYSDGTLPLIDGSVVAPHDSGAWRHYSN